MVNLMITTTFLTTNPTAIAAGNAYCLQLGDSNFIIPSINKFAANPGNPASYRYGSDNQIMLRANETFCIENQVFQALVNSAREGGDTSWLNRIMFLVNYNVIQVQQDSGTPLTSDEILAYVSP